MLLEKTGMIGQAETLKEQLRKMQIRVIQMIASKAMRSHIAAYGKPVVAIIKAHKTTAVVHFRFDQDERHDWIKTRDEYERKLQLMQPKLD